MQRPAAFSSETSRFYNRCGKAQALGQPERSGNEKAPRVFMAERTLSPQSPRPWCRGSGGPVAIGVGDNPEAAPPPICGEP